MGIIYSQNFFHKVENFTKEMPNAPQGPAVGWFLGSKGIREMTHRLAGIRNYSLC